MRGAAGRSGWRHRLSVAVTEQVPLKLAAIFFAFVLWVGVRAEEPTSEWIPVRVSLSAGNGALLGNSSEPAVRALVVGRGRELLKLYQAQPTVRRVVEPGSDGHVSLELRPEDVDVPNGVDAVVRDVQPRTLTMLVGEMTAPASRRAP